MLLALTYTTKEGRTSPVLVNWANVQYVKEVVVEKKTMSVIHFLNRETNEKGDYRSLFVDQTISQIKRKVTA